MSRYITAEMFAPTANAMPSCSFADWPPDDIRQSGVTNGARAGEKQGAAIIKRLDRIVELLEAQSGPRTVNAVPERLGS